jgi:hypothetical protein
MSADPGAPARRVTVRRFDSHEEADREDRAYWAQLTAQQRVLLAWTLSVEQWALAGHPHEPGLCRSVARLVRG